MPDARVRLEHMDAATAEAIREVLVEEDVHPDAIEYRG